MAMGIREHEPSSLWIATSALPKSPGHPFYTRLNALLDAHHFDPVVEGLCRPFYSKVMGRPSLAPGRYFRLLLVGYFEGIDSERGIAWRATDSLAIRTFLRLPLDEAPPDHSTISRTRRVMDLETHRAVFTWVQQRLVEAGMLNGKTVAIDATTLEANAAMRSIVRRDTAETYQEFLTGLAKASGIETPTRDDLARLDRKRKKNLEQRLDAPLRPRCEGREDERWPHASGPQSRACRRSGHRGDRGRHAAGGRPGDTTTIVDTASAAVPQLADAQAGVAEPQSLDEIVADKGDHSHLTMVDLAAGGIRSDLAEPDRGRRDGSETAAAQAPV